MIRVRTDLCFSDEDESVARSVYDRANSVLQKAVRIAVGGEETGEVSFIEMHRCHHDEDPPRPCEVIERIEV